MRGSEQIQDAMFSYISAAQRVPQDHPLRPVRKMVDEALKELSPKFERMYSDVGRPSIPPEQLLADSRNKRAVRPSRWDRMAAMSHKSVLR